MKTWKQIARAAGFLGIYFAGQFTGGMIFAIFCYLIAASKTKYTSPSDFHIIAEQANALAGRNMGIALIIAGALSLAVYLIIFGARKVNPLKQVDFKKISGPDVLFTFVGAIGTLLFANYILEILPIPETVITSLNDAVGRFNEMPLWQGLIADVLFVPVLEEIVFRGLVYGRLRRGMPDIVAAVITSVAFGLGHGHPIWMVWAFAVGMILNYARMRTGSILPGIIIHILVNGFSFLMNNGIIRFEETDTLIIILTVLGALLLAVFFTGLYKVTKKEKEEGKIKEPLLEEEEVAKPKDETTVVVM